MPSVHSTALTFVASPTMRQIEAVIRDPFLKSLFRGAIASPLLDYQYNPLDIIPHLDHGATSYTLDPRVATSLWSLMTKMAQVVHCAAHDFDPYTSGKELPITLPRDRLKSLQLSTPTLSYVLAFPHRNPLLDAFPSMEQLRFRLQLVQHIACSYLVWIGKGIERSVAQGMACSWNWGAYWGMQWEEFLERLEQPAKYIPVVPVYDNKAVDDSLTMILHPSLSTPALRANNIYNGRIPIRGGPITVDFPLAESADDFAHLFLN
ncbi:hypothetical protein FPV67DRAFT_1675643 [Lyophyllum atratum]|nr:hypothetical protein FPV67DRAFT_1675643 [Lyophyllum atratum]